MSGFIIERSFPHAILQEKQHRIVIVLTAAFCSAIKDISELDRYTQCQAENHRQNNF